MGAGTARNRAIDHLRRQRNTAVGWNLWTTSPVRTAENWPSAMDAP